MVFSTNTVNRGDYEPITVPITLGSEAYQLQYNMPYPVI
jgi:hypothetical protein